MTDPPAPLLHHIAIPAEWAEAQATGIYDRSTRGRSLADEGFIHCSYRHQVDGTANLFYGDLEAVVLLTIDPARLESPVVVEAAEPGGDEFPHVYGPIPVAAVTSAVMWPRGSWSAPEG